MDPVSTLLAAYLNSIEDPVAESWLAGKNGVEKAISVEFEGYKVHYSYAKWGIDRSSVCNQYQLTNINSHAVCTGKAIALFAQACESLNKGTSNGKAINSRYRSYLQNMYCSAATNFTPAVAMISKPAKGNELQIARRECNAATLKARGSSDAYLIRKRDVLCETYQLLKQP